MEVGGEDMVVGGAEEGAVHADSEQCSPSHKQIMTSDCDLYNGHETSYGVLHARMRPAYKW